MWCLARAVDGAETGGALLLELVRLGLRKEGAACCVCARVRASAPNKFCGRGGARARYRRPSASASAALNLRRRSPTAPHNTPPPHQSPTNPHRTEMHLLSSSASFAAAPSARARGVASSSHRRPRSSFVARHSRGVASTLAIPDLPPHLQQELDELEESGHCGTEGEGELQHARKEREEPLLSSPTRGRPSSASRASSPSHHHHQ